MTAAIGLSWSFVALAMLGTSLAAPVWLSTLKTDPELAADEGTLITAPPLALRAPDMVEPALVAQSNLDTGTGDPVHSADGLAMAPSRPVPQSSASATAGSNHVGFATLDAVIANGIPQPVTAAPVQPTGAVTAEAALPESITVLGRVHASAPQRALANAAAHLPETLIAAVVPHAIEDGLALDRQARRSVQIKLGLLGHSPGGADGIFGPRTRSAIQSLQAAESLPPTGYLDKELLATLDARSEIAYAAWQERQRRDAIVRKAEPSPPIVAVVPEPRNASQCARDQSGTVIQNQSFSCDLIVLQESLRALFRGGRS